MNSNPNADAAHASVHFSFYLAGNGATASFRTQRSELIPYHEDELSAQHSCMITILPTQVEEQTNTRL